MSILVVTSFAQIEEAQQVFRTLEQLQRDGHSGLQALMITKNADGTQVGTQLGGGKANLPVFHDHEDQEPNRALLASILAAMTPGSSSLFLTIAETEATAIVLTLLLLSLPNKHSVADPTNAALRVRQEDNLNRILESYQRSVSKLDQLDATSTEADVDNAYSAVESVYATLMTSFRDVVGPKLPSRPISSSKRGPIARE